MGLCPLGECVYKTRVDISCGWVSLTGTSSNRSVDKSYGWESVTGIKSIR